MSTAASPVRPSRVGFTTRASCLIAAGVTAIVCGLVLGEVDLTRAGSLALAVPLVAAVVVHRSRLTIAAGRSADPARSSSEVRAVVHLSLTNRSMLPSGALMLEDQLPHQVPGRARFVLDGLAGRESRTVAYTMPTLPRGRYRAGPLQLRVIDPFGLVDLTRAFPDTSDFIMTPRVERLPSLMPPVSFDVGENVGSHSVGARGADDASTREYRTGDDLRKIHWRSTARIGSLMVRQEERPWQGSTTLLVDLRAAGHIHARTDVGDERLASSLEWTISAAASIANHLMPAGRELSILDDPQRVGSSGAAARARYPSAAAYADALTDVRAVHQGDLREFGPALRAAGRESTLLAVLGRLDPVSVRVLIDAHPRGGSVPAFAILLDVQSWAGPVPAADVVPAGPPEPDSAWQRDAAALRAAGWQVVSARRGDSVADAWTRLLMPAASGRTGSLSR